MHRKVFFNSPLKLVDRLLTLVCMIRKVTIGVGEMRFMFCDLLVSLKLPFPRNINSTNLPCLTFVLAGGTSDSCNFSHSFHLK